MKYKMPFTDRDFSLVNETRTDGGKNPKNTKKDELIKELEGLKGLADSALDDAVSKQFESEFMQKDGRTDEQIKKTVEDEANIKKQSEIEKAYESANEEHAKLDQTRAKQAEDKQNEIKNVNYTYDEAKENAQNQALKRGLQRSSVIMNLLKEYDDGKFAKFNEIDAKYEDKNSALDEQIAKLDKDLADSIKKLDFETAINVQSEIEKLKKERDDKNAEVLKYNNQLSEKIAKYKQNLENSEYGKKILAAVEEQKNAYYRKMVDKVIGYYQTLSNDEMLDDYLSGEYEKLLGASGLKLLRTYVTSRQNQAK